MNLKRNEMPSSSINPKKIKSNRGFHYNRSYYNPGTIFTRDKNGRWFDTSGNRLSSIVITEFPHYFDDITESDVTTT